MRAGKETVQALAPLVQRLWPEHTVDSLEKILAKYAENEESAIFAETENGKYIAVALCCLRHDYVEGCETSPVGYLEGIFVCEAYRRQGIGARLVKECEAWAKNKGCAEFASDCELTNAVSLQFHLRAGFDEENRLICFRKTL